MSTDTTDQGQDFCRILVLTDEGTGTPTVQLESQIGMGVAAESGGLERAISDPFPSSCLIPVDIETGSIDMSKIEQEKTGGSIRSEIALTKALRRQNSLQTGGESIPPLMNHILMLLKINSKGKQAVERTHDAVNNRWRKYKRAASFDSRKIVLLFSILSSMGTILLIFLTLRVREGSDSYFQS